MRSVGSQRAVSIRIGISELTQGRSVFSGQHQVEGDHIEVAGCQGVSHVIAVAHGFAVGAETTKKLTQFQVIVDDQDACGAGAYCS